MVLLPFSLPVSKSIFLIEIALTSLSAQPISGLDTILDPKKSCSKLKPLRS